MVSLGSWGNKDGENWCLLRPEMKCKACEGFLWEPCKDIKDNRVKCSECKVVYNISEYGIDPNREHSHMNKWNDMTYRMSKQLAEEQGRFLNSCLANSSTGKNLSKAFEDIRKGVLSRDESTFKVPLKTQSIFSKRNIPDSSYSLDSRMEFPAPKSKAELLKPLFIDHANANEKAIQDLARQMSSDNERSTHLSSKSVTLARWALIVAIMSLLIATIAQLLD